MGTGRRPDCHGTVVLSDTKISGFSESCCLANMQVRGGGIGLFRVVGRTHDRDPSRPPELSSEVSQNCNVLPSVEAPRKPSRWRSSLYGMDTPTECDHCQSTRRAAGSDEDPNPCGFCDGPPLALPLADGTYAREGDRVFNHYDRYAVTIYKIDATPEVNGIYWCQTTMTDGHYGPTLDGHRMVSLDFAQRKGWL